MTGQEIIDKILFIKGLNAKSFSEKIGLDRPQAIYDIQKGKTKAISGQLANKIISVFPDFNKIWLLTGEGPETNIATSNKTQASLIPSEFVEALFEERKRHDEMNAEFLQQNAELIRQNGKLIQLLEENKKTVVQKDVSCADVKKSGSVE